MPSFRLLGAALLIFSSTALARPTLDPKRIDQLAHYQVLVFADPFEAGLERGKAIGVIDATPEEVFRVATDYTKWKEFIPRLRGSQVTARARHAATVEMTADLPWPAGRNEVVAQYRHERLPGEIYRVQFHMVRGTMRRYLGSMYIEPFANGKAALTYELVAQPDVLAPRSMINRAVRRTASGFVHALRQRVNDLHRLGLLHPKAPPLKRAPAVETPRSTRTAEAPATVDVN